MKSIRDIDFGLSQKLAAELKAKPKCCYFNAQLGTLHISKSKRKVRYVEGAYTTMPNFVTDHAWLEIGRRVVDPTLVTLGKDCLEVFYFAGNRYTPHYVRKHIGDGNGRVIAFWSVNFTNKTFLKHLWALREAWKFRGVRLPRMSSIRQSGKS